jgi:hypothetical protein
MKTALRLLLLFFFPALLNSCLPPAGRNGYLPEASPYQNSLLLMFTPHRYMYQYQQQLDMYREASEELLTRDIHIVEVYPIRGKNYREQWLNPALIFRLRLEHKISDEKFVNVLVGKDGECKLLKEGLLSPTDLFHFVDTLNVSRLQQERR